MKKPMDDAADRMAEALKEKPVNPKVKAHLSKLGYSGPINDPIHLDVIYWYRKVPGTVHHQYEVKRWSHFKDGETFSSYDVQMTFETRNEIWATQKFYGLSDTKLILNLERLEARLKQSAMYMDANPLHYRYNGKD